MKHLLTAIRMTIFMSVLTGVVYPVAVTAIAQALFKSNANGGLSERSGTGIGAELIAQSFSGERYFWSRPSAAGYNSGASSGSNLAPTSADLKRSYDERLAKLRAAHPEQSGEPPQDLLFASGSGLDPHISPQAAVYQLARVAKARRLDVGLVSKLVADATEGRQFGLLGEPRVNVLKLNLALDREQGITSAPTPAP